MLHVLLTVRCRVFNSSGINSTASYFGDIHLLPGDIDGIVELVFEEGEEESTQKGNLLMIACFGSFEILFLSYMQSIVFTFMIYFFLTTMFFSQP